MVNKEYPLYTNFNWNDIYNHGVVNEKLDLLAKDESGILLYTWCSLQTLSFIWQFKDHPNNYVSKGIWIGAPILCFGVGGWFFEDRSSALLIALIANCLATLEIKRFARSDAFRARYGLDTYQQNLDQVKQMRALQKEAKLMYVGIPHHLIPEHMRAFVPQTKKKGGKERLFGFDPQETFDLFRSMTVRDKSKTDEQNAVLYQKHQLKNQISKISDAEIAEFEEYKEYKNKSWIPRVHKAAWWSYRLREPHDRKVFGISQRGYESIEREKLREIQQTYAAGEKHSTEKLETTTEEEIKNAQVDEDHVPEPVNYFELNLDDLYVQAKQHPHGEVDWFMQEKEGIMRFEKQAKENQEKGRSRHFGKIGNSDPMHHVQ